MSYTKNKQMRPWQEDAKFDLAMVRRCSFQPMKSMLKAPGTKRLKLNCDELLSSFAFKFNLRRYAMCYLKGRGVEKDREQAMVGRCRLTL